MNLENFDQYEDYDQAYERAELKLIEADAALMQAQADEINYRLMLNKKADEKWKEDQQKYSKWYWRLWFSFDRALSQLGTALIFVFLLVVTAMTLPMIVEQINAERAEKLRMENFYKLDLERQKYNLQLDFLSKKRNLDKNLEVINQMGNRQ